MNVLLTGGSGFIGSHVLSKLMDSSHNILSFSKNTTFLGKNLFQIDARLSDYKNIESDILNFDPDVLLHLAWEGIPDFSSKTSYKNLINSIDFIDFIINNTKCSKFIITGSCFEYGKRNGECKESDKIEVNSYFTWAKTSLYNYLKMRTDEKGKVLNWFRLFYVYGTGQRAESLIPTLVNSIIQKKTPSVNFPLNRNDFVEVSDVAKVLIQSIDKDLLSGIYNLGSGKTISVSEICYEVEKQILNDDYISNKVLKKGRKEQNVNFWSSMEKINDSFQTLRFMSLQKGIKKYIETLNLKDFS